MRKIIFVIFLVLLLNPLFNYSQDGFSRDDNRFFEELKELFSGLDRGVRQEREELIDSFAVVWQQSNLRHEQKQLVFETFDAMTGLRLRVATDYPLYIKGLIAVLQTRNSVNNYEVWHESFEGLLTLRNQRRFINNLEYSLNLFSYNAVYQTPNVLWKYDNDNYFLRYENDTLKVEFSGGNLILYAQRDSLIIHNTNGVVLPFEELWHGAGGRVTWQRVELNPAEVYASLKNYSINLKVARYEADSVEFYNTNFFDTPLIGKLSERIVADVKPENSRYPSFESYQVVHEIKNIFPDISYVGGFTMQGQRVLGSGTDDGNAYIYIYENDSLFVSANAKAFSIRDDRISSDRASVSIYYSGDSIYHPVIQMRYLHSTGEFYLLRDEKGISRAPFVNTYHNIDMYCQALYWYKGTTEISFQSIRGFTGEGAAIFESRSFFNDMLFMRLQGIADINPLFLLRNYARDNETKTFSVKDYTRHTRSNPQSTKSLLMQLSQFGFVDYNFDTDEVTVNEKLYHYIGAALGRSDYDVMRLESHARVNAKINLLNFDLHIEGINRIPLSSSKNVVIHPFGNRVIMQKNRDIYFNGRIESGLFDFFGKEFFFDYDEFKIDLVNTDSLSFRVKSFKPDSRGIHSYVRVRTVLEGINGELLIDHPENKSGRLPIPHYPIFNSNNESFVYYDREYVQSGTYRRADVYFKLVPFTVDSLDHATTDNIAFDGVFISTGIFPEFTDYLTVQSDYSLGFNSHTPEEGYPVFGGKAHYYGPIDMSYEGLMANGKMEYLNSTIEAEKMIMFLDSARADVRTFNIAEQLEPVEYPEVTAKNVNMLFLPYQDDLTISETDEPIELYAGMSQLRGNLSITPTGVTGNGKVDLFGSEISADFLAFNARSFDSPNADFKIYTLDGERVAFNAFNYNGHFDLDVFSGVLDVGDEYAKVSFPENRFDGYGYNFDWNMQEQSLSLENIVAPDQEDISKLSLHDIIDLDFSGHELLSTHRAQDSLRFFAGKLDFSIVDNIINASEVNVIKVADAAIFPDKNEVSVLLRAEIQRLENAKIIADTDSMFHYFYDANAEVLTRNRFRATGKYDYVDMNLQKQQIYFDEIGVIAGQNTTYAKGKIFDDQAFTLSPQFAFKGSVELTASEKHMKFIGSTKIFADCNPIQFNWFRFENVINPENIQIPVSDDIKSDANVDLRSALVLAGDSFHVYTAFFDRKRHHLDVEIISANGYLVWNNISREYQLSSLERIRNRNNPDNFIRFNPATCMIEGEGEVEIGSDFGQLKTKAYGTVTHHANNQRTEYDVVLGMDFFFVDDGINLMANTIDELKQLRPINLNRQKYLKAYRKLTGEVQTALLLEEFLETGTFRRIPPELSHTIYFADIKLFWDQRTNSFISRGALGIGNINRMGINRYVNGYMQIRKQRGGDIITFILEPSPGGQLQEVDELSDLHFEDIDEYDVDVETEGAEGETGYDTEPADIDEKADQLALEEDASENDQDEPKEQKPGAPSERILGSEYFYFTYSNSILQVIAANEDFNSIIRDMNPRRRRMDVPSGESPFAFILSTERRPFDFIRVMRQISN